MTRQFLALATVGAVALAGCAGDPTSSISGTPARIRTSLSLVQLNINDSTVATASTIDAQGGVLATVPTATSSDEAVATISPVNQPPLSEVRFFIKAVGPGSARIDLTTDGITDSITVVVFPNVFDGTVTVNTAGRLDTITVAASSLVTFDSTATEVLVDGGATRMIARTDQELKVLALATNPITGATVSVVDAVFLSGTANETTVDALDATTTVDVRGEPDEPANDDRATATPTASGATVTGSVTGDDASDFYSFSVTTGQVIDISAAFTDGPDIDLILYDPTGDDVAVAFTLNNPEAIQHTALMTGTYAVEVNLFSGEDVTPPYWYDLLVNVN